MQGILWLIKGVIAFFGSLRGVLPQSIIGFFVLIKFFVNLFNHGFMFAFTEIATSIFSAEYVIYTNVSKAIINSPDYTFLSFLEIITSLMILYYLVRMIAGFVEFVNGYGTTFGRYIVAILFVIVVEVSAIRMITGNLDFIPIYDGIFFLIRNITYVFNFI